MQMLEALCAHMCACFSCAMCADVEYWCSGRWQLAASSTIGFQLATRIAQSVAEHSYVARITVQNFGLRSSWRCIDFGMIVSSPFCAMISEALGYCSFRIHRPSQTGLCLMPPDRGILFLAPRHTKLCLASKFRLAAIGKNEWADVRRKDKVAYSSTSCFISYESTSYRPAV